MIHGKGGAQFQPSGALGEGPGRPLKEVRVRTPKGRRPEKLPALEYVRRVRSSGRDSAIILEPL